MSGGLLLRGTKILFLMATLLMGSVSAARVPWLNEIDRAIMLEREISNELEALLGFQLGQSNFKLAVKVNPLAWDGELVNSRLAACSTARRWDGEAKVSVLLAPVFEVGYEQTLKVWLSEFAHKRIGSGVVTEVDTAAAPDIKVAGLLDLARGIRNSPLFLGICLVTGFNLLIFAILIGQYGSGLKVIGGLSALRARPRRIHHHLAEENIRLKQEIVGLNHLWKSSLETYESIKKENAASQVRAENLELERNHYRWQVRELESELHKLRISTLEGRLRAAGHEATKDQTQGEAAVKSFESAMRDLLDIK